MEGNRLKTAVLLSGQARTFARCLPSLHWQVFRKLENLSFYVSIANDADAKSMELLRAKYPSAKVCIEYVDQPNLSEPAAILAAHAPYAISSSIQAILKQLWHLSRVWKFAQENGAAGADVFVRCRPDLHFHRFVIPDYGNHCDLEASRLVQELIHEKNEFPVENQAITPWWGCYGGTNDRFGIFGKRAAKAFFEAYDSLPELIADGCPIHPESIVCASMERQFIHIRRDLIAEFGAVRTNGEFIHMRPTAQEAAELNASLCR